MKMEHVLKNQGNTDFMKKDTPKEYREGVLQDFISASGKESMHKYFF